MSIASKTLKKFYNEEKKEIHSCAQGIVHHFFSMSRMSLSIEYLEKDENRMIAERNNEVKKMHLIVESSRIIYKINCIFKLIL